LQSLPLLKRAGSQSKVRFRNFHPHGCNALYPRTQEDEGKTQGGFLSTRLYVVQRQESQFSPGAGDFLAGKVLKPIGSL